MLHVKRPGTAVTVRGMAQEHVSPMHKQLTAGTARSKDLLTGVHGSEINWDHVPPALEGATSGQIPFVYFIGEENDGPVKIGTATNPVKRLRGLQTGNPRRLRIERLIYGEETVERLLHRYFATGVIGGKRRTTQFKPSHAKGTEWFDARMRSEIFNAAEAIWSMQRAIPKLELTVNDLTLAVHASMSNLGYELRAQDEVRLLGRSGGYATVGLGL